MLGQEFSLHVLKEMCKGNSLAVSGSKAELARRLAVRSLLPAPTGVRIQRRPSKAQLIYIAAICSRQGLVPELGVIMTADGARLWLTANQDRASPSQ